jgi:hypothetical protein
MIYYFNPLQIDSNQKLPVSPPSTTHSSLHNKDLRSLVFEYPVIEDDKHASNELWVALQ